MPEMGAVEGQRVRPVRPNLDFAVNSHRQPVPGRLPSLESDLSWLQSVTAPLLADDTCLAYFANTPRV